MGFVHFRGWANGGFLACDKDSSRQTVAQFRLETKLVVNVEKFSNQWHPTLTCRNK